MNFFAVFFHKFHSIFAMIFVLFIFGFVQVRTDDSTTVEVITCPRIVSRLEWGAEDPLSTKRFPELPEFVVICHTATDECHNLNSCSAKVRAMQSYHKRQKNWGDISYNFIVGGDGAVYEGRGWNFVGAHSRSYNDKSIAIAFIGTFTDKLPNENSINAARSLIKCGISKGKISEGYKLVGHRQVISTASPGNKLYNQIQSWEKWSPDQFRKD